MILSMSNQVKLFLLAILIGLTTGFIYDMIKTIRKIIRHNNFAIQVEDFLFWIIISASTFFIMLNKNSGQIRGYCIGGALFGMLLYSLTLSKFVVSTSVGIVNFFIKIIMNALRIIFLPVKFVIKIIPWQYFIAVKNFFQKYLYISNHYAKIKSKRTLNNLKIIFKKI